MNFGNLKLIVPFEEPCKDAGRLERAEKGKIGEFLSLFGSEELNQFKVLENEPWLHEWPSVLEEQGACREKRRAWEETFEKRIEGLLQEIEWFERKSHLLFTEGMREEGQSNGRSLLDEFFRPNLPDLCLKRECEYETRDDFQAFVLGLELTRNKFEKEYSNEPKIISKDIEEIIKNELGMEAQKALEAFLKDECQETEELINYLELRLTSARLQDVESKSGLLTLLLAKWAGKLFTKCFSAYLSLIKHESGREFPLILTLFSEGFKNFTQSVENIEKKTKMAQKKMSILKTQIFPLEKAVNEHFELWKGFMSVWDQNVYQTFKEDLLDGFEEILTGIRQNSRKNLEEERPLSPLLFKLPKKARSDGLLYTKKEREQNGTTSDPTKNAPKLSSLLMSPEIEKFLEEFDDFSKPKVPLSGHFLKNKEDSFAVLKLFSNFVTDLGLDQSSIFGISTFSNSSKLSKQLFELETRVVSVTQSYYGTLFEELLFSGDFGFAENMMRAEKKILDRIFPKCTRYSVFGAVLETLEGIILGKSRGSLWGREKDILRIESESIDESQSTLDEDVFESLQKALVCFSTNLKAHVQMMDSLCFNESPTGLSKIESKSHGLESYEFFDIELEATPEPLPFFSKMRREESHKGFQSVYYSEFKLEGEIDDGGFAYFVKT